MNLNAATVSTVRHSDPVAFLADASPVFARDDAMASSYVAWAMGLLRNPAPASERVYMATYRDGDVAGAAVVRGAGTLWLGASDPAAAAAFADDLFAQCAEQCAEDAPPLQGIVGLRSACAAFAQRWLALTGQPHEVRVHLRNHRLTRVQSVPRPSGAPRVATATDIDWLGDSQRDFIVEIELPEDPERLRALVPQRVANGQFWIWEDAGAVAFAGWTDAPPDAARVAPVYTLPHARGRGYATALVAAMSQALLDDGRRKLFLITDLANPVSNAIYAKIGYQPQSDLFHFDFLVAG